VTYGGFVAVIETRARCPEALTVEILFVDVVRSVSTAITLSAWSRVVRAPLLPLFLASAGRLAWECFADHPGRLSTTVVRDIDGERRRPVNNAGQNYRHIPNSGARPQNEPFVVGT